jgi:hypothetical protein
MNRKQAVATNSERHANQVEGKPVTQSQLDFNSKSILDYTATDIPFQQGYAWLSRRNVNRQDHERPRVISGFTPIVSSQQ